MNILACADHNFVMPCGVMMYSLCHSNPNVNVHFYMIIDETFTESDKRDIEDTIKSVNVGNKATFILITDQMLDEVSWYHNSYYPKQVFYRLFAASLLPKEIDKILYLDGDIVVRKPLQQLWDTDLTDISVGAVPDALSGIVGIYNRVQYPMSLGYFNSGVLLINLKYWRENNVERDFSLFMKEHADIITLPDQDTLNYTLRLSKMRLPIKYNLQPSFLYKNRYMKFCIYEYKEELDEARTNPVVMHYAGAGNRPWEQDCIHPFKEEFFRYQQQTKWRDAPLRKSPFSLKHKALNTMRRMLAPLHLAHYESDYYNRSIILSK